MPREVCLVAASASNPFGSGGYRSGRRCSAGIAIWSVASGQPSFGAPRRQRPVRDPEQRALTLKVAGILCSQLVGALGHHGRGSTAEYLAPKAAHSGVSRSVVGKTERRSMGCVSSGHRSPYFFR